MRRYIAIASALLLAGAASAQNLNPTVQVTNAYDNKLMDISKHTLEMAVPDSLLRFDWNFNYSVFDNPYKGAYEFNPYIIEMKPAASVYDGSRLYFRGGVGYSLHPEAIAVWNPQLGNKLGLVVYDDFKGYWGNYAGIGCEDRSAGDHVIKGDGKYNGFDMSNKFGVGLNYDASKSIVTWDAGVDYLCSAGKDLYHYLLRGHDALTGSTQLRVRSNAPLSDFGYDASLRASYLNDKLSWGDHVGEYSLGASVLGAYSLEPRHRVRMLADLGRTGYTERAGQSDDVWKMGATHLELTPSYSFISDRFEITGGLRFSNVWRNADARPLDELEAYMDLDEEVPVDADEEADKPVKSYRGRKFYPYAHVAFEAVEDAMVLFADVTGGQKFNTYASYVSSNHWFSASGPELYLPVLGDVTVNTFDASAGVSGRIGSKFQYKLDGGYSRFFNAPVDGIDFIHPDEFYYVYDMANYDLLYSDLEASWSSERLDVLADVRAQKTMFRNFKYAATLPAFSGMVDMTYNWNRRVFAGLSAQWATARRADGQEVSAILPPSLSEMPSDYVCTIPGWVDLGLSFEYKFKGMSSIWAKGGNLLNQNVRKNLLVAETGPYFTLGFCLSL